MERIRLAFDCTIYPIGKNTKLTSFCCEAFTSRESNYQKNGFRFLYPDEKLEKEAFHIDVGQSLNTWMMYLDLVDFVS